MAFALALSPLSALAPVVEASGFTTGQASTPIDLEVQSNPQWYAYAGLFEAYEVPPPPHLASLTAQVIAEENWPSDALVHYHLVNYLLAFERVDASASSDELKAVYLDLFESIVPVISADAEPDADILK